MATRDDRRRGKPLRVLTTREMIGNLRASHYHRYELPLHSAPVRFPYREVPIDPYALGLLLGDGCLTGTTTPSFATGDPELAWELQLRLPGSRSGPGRGTDYQLNRVTSPGDVITLENPVTLGARELGLPAPVRPRSSCPTSTCTTRPRSGWPSCRACSTPTAARSPRRDRTCRVQYTTSSPRLRDDVIFLVRSLGGVAYYRTRPAAGAPPGLAKGRPVYHRHDAHIIDIRLPEGIEPFRLHPEAGRL